MSSVVTRKLLVSVQLDCSRDTVLFFRGSRTTSESKTRLLTTINLKVPSRLPNPTLVLMYPRAATFRSFPLRVPFNFPLNLRTVSSHPRGSRKPSDIKLQSVILSISMFTISLAHVNPFRSGGKIFSSNFSCRHSGIVVGSHNLPHSAFIQGRPNLFQQWY